MNGSSLSVKQNMLWNTIGCLFYQGCLWLMTVAVVLVSHDYANSGILAFAMSVGNIYYPFATYNMRTIQVSDLREEHSSSEYIAFRFITIGLAFIPIVGYLFLSTSNSRLIVSAIFWLLFKADEAFCSVFYAMVQKEGRMDYIGISQAIRGLGGLVLFLLPLVFGLSINYAFLSLAIFCCFITWLFDARSASNYGKIIPSISFHQALVLIKKYFPSVLTAVFFGAVVSVSRQQLAQLKGTEALGVYAAVSTPTVLVQAAASYLYGPLLVGFAEIWSKHECVSFAQRYGKVISCICLFTLLAIVFCSLFGDNLLQAVFGSSISQGFDLLIPAIIATAFTTIFAFSFDLLILIREIRGSFIATSAALLISYLCSASLISRFGANGVSIAVIVSYSVGMLIALSFFYQRLKSNLKFKH